MSEDLLEILKKVVDVSKAEKEEPKPKKTRKRVFTEEQKQKLRDQLIKARDAKKAKREQEKLKNKTPEKEEPKIEEPKIEEPKEEIIENKTMEPNEEEPKEEITIEITKDTSREIKEPVHNPELEELVKPIGETEEKPEIKKWFLPNL